MNVLTANHNKMAVGDWLLNLFLLFINISQIPQYKFIN